jgi:hypothetical protein
VSTASNCAAKEANASNVGGGVGGITNYAQFLHCARGLTCFVPLFDMPLRSFARGVALHYRSVVSERRCGVDGDEVMGCGELHWYMYTVYDMPPRSLHALSLRCVSTTASVRFVTCYTVLGRCVVQRLQRL